MGEAKDVNLGEWESGEDCGRGNKLYSESISKINLFSIKKEKEKDLGTREIAAE